MDSQPLVPYNVYVAQCAAHSDWSGKHLANPSILADLCQPPALPHRTMPSLNYMFLFCALCTMLIINKLASMTTQAHMTTISFCVINMTCASCCHVRISSISYYNAFH